MLSLSDLRNEWRVLGKHPLVWVVWSGVAAFTVLIARGSPPDPGATAGEALFRLNLFLPGFMLPFAAGALAPSAYLREAEWDLAEIVGSYPVTAQQWLAARTGHLVLLLMTACGLAEAIFVAVLGQDYPETVHLLIAHSLAWLVVIQLPACLLWASGLAWLASRKSHAGLLYVAAGVGWLGYLGLATLTGTPLIAGSFTAWPPLQQAMLVIDPYGATALSTPMPEQGLLQWRWLNLGIGRVMWLGIAFALLRSIVTVPSLADRRAPANDTAGKGGAPQAPGTRPSHVGLHLRFFVRDRVFPLLLLAWLALFVPEVVGGIGYAEPLSRIDADSRDALNRVVWDVLPLASALLLAYAADRICRMYQATRMHELYGATPHGPQALVAVQLSAMGLITIGSVVLTGLSVAFAQLVAGSPIQPREYGLQLGLALLPLALLGALFVAVHTLIRSRLFANLACLLLAALGQSSLAPSLGLSHPLWKVLASPLSAPDHYWGFANGIAGHLAFVWFWTTVIVALLLLAIARSHRTLPTPQLRLAQVVRHPASATAAIVLGIAVWQGVAIDRTLAAEGALTSPDERTALRADYERGYAGWMATAQPDVEEVNAQVDFHPGAGRVDVRGVLVLVNRSERPIHEVLVGMAPNHRSGVLALHGGVVEHTDARLGQTVFRLERPMLAGERRHLAYRGSVLRSGLAEAAFPLVIADEFSSLPAAAVLPVVGFKRELTLRDPAVRAQQGLPDLNLPPPSRLGLPQAGTLSRDRVMVDAVVSAPTGHHGIAQGALIQRWQAGGRVYFHYRTDRPIRNALTFLSVVGEPQQWRAGAVTVWTHTLQPLAATDATVLAARDTLALLTRDVAPFPGKDLHLVAIPEIGPSGYALPQIVQLSHRLSIRARPQERAGFSQIYRRAAHETAHQWFGHLLGHGVAAERAFLVESLAKYAELVVVERRFGTKAVEALVAFERDRYRQERLDPDRPVAALIDAEESEDMYSRATLAFACLRMRTGDAPILAALNALAQDMAATDRPATSLGFVQALRSAAPGQTQAIDALLLGHRPIAAVERELGCIR